MNSEQFSLREEERVVLQQIQDGNDDTHRITEATTLENDQVRYCFHNLDDLDLVTVEQPDGYVTRTSGGQKRTFRAPKQATLTEAGRQYLQQVDDGIERYEDLSRDELVRKVHELEEQITELEARFELFRKQVQQQLD